MSIRYYAAALIAGCLAAAAAPAQDLTLDQILEKNQQAIGGADAIKRVETLKMTIKMVMGEGPMEAPMTIQVKRPSLVRTDLSFQGRTLVSAYDGTTGWMINPMTGSPDPQKVDEKTASGMASSDINSMIGALSGIQAAGHTLELIGQEDVAGASAYRIKLTRKNGAVSTYFLDAATFFPIKTVAKVTQMGREVEVEGYPGNFKEVGGLTLAHTLEQKVGGSSVARLQVEKIEINPPIDDAIFKMPTAEKPAEKPPEKK